MSGSWLLLLAVLLCLLLLAVVLALVVTDPGPRGGRGRRVRPPRSAFRRAAKGGELARRQRAAIIINPTKVPDVAVARDELAAVCERLEWDEPIFYETTVDDPGTGQARLAVDEGVDLVCPLGGDGTIRAVAVALAGTRIPMGMLPRGTGNLLARNLDVPFGDVEESFRVACSGRNRAIDVAWLELDPVAEVEADDEAQAEKPVTGPPVERHPFLVMAGMGFDAEIMGGTSEELKSSVGWTAYVVTGMRKLFVKRFQVRWTVDGQAQKQVAARTIVFGNCGILTGGIVLMPQAQLDDGLLDCVVVSPKTIFGWGALAGRVLSRSEKDMTQLVRRTGSEFTVEVDDAHPVQVDGDVIGEAHRLRVTVDKQALIVRVR
ncbi:NAD(+)/NADH kinase [Janibacter sp. YIM B02568]|uniref:diacylglycerol/lipid kinase family protein n=1 Tax=Janibacter endophyticus TaxID=2806261 RepID=UPI001951D037|nr:diacylglycerol kinase family protein [Janibacter endophyticus]MBM6545174.1 NAD(+)/NADH kinase [Janibacter endophyticus]